MKTLLTLSAAGAILLSTACTSRTLYDSLRYRQELECQKMTEGRGRDECMRRAGMSYDEDRQELKKQEQEREKQQSRALASPSFCWGWKALPRDPERTAVASKQFREVALFVGAFGSCGRGFH